MENLTAVFTAYVQSLKPYLIIFGISFAFGFIAGFWL